VEDVLRLLVWCCYESGNLVRDLGFPDLALLATSLMHEATGHLGDPTYLAVTGFARTHALSSVSTSAFGAAVEVGTSAAEQVLPTPSSEALSAYGSLQLAVAFALAVAGFGPDAAERLTEAERVAARLDTATEIGRHLAFGAPNVELHRIATAVELGDPDSALQAARRVQPEQGPLPRPPSIALARCRPGAFRTP